MATLLTFRVLLTFAVLLGASASPAAVVDVFPGPGTPLQDAIDAASPRDTLELHPGTYNEAITITKSLRLQARNGDVTIAAGCIAPVAVTIAADDVLLRGEFFSVGNSSLLSIEGGTTSVVDVQNRDGVTIKTGVLVEGGCPGVQHGLNVLDSTNVRIRHVAVHGATPYADAAIRVEASSRVTVSQTSVGPGARGIVVADCPLQSRILVKRTYIGTGSSPEVTDGIVLENSDGVGVIANRTFSVLDTGIQLDSASDDNRLIANWVFEPTGGPNVVDDGTSNCWRSNHCLDATCPGPEGCP